MRIPSPVLAVAFLLLATPSLAAQANGCGLEYQNMINAENLYWDSIDYAYTIAEQPSPDPLDITLAQYMIDSSWSLLVSNTQTYFQCASRTWPV